MHANAVSLIANRMPVMAGNLGGEAIIAAGCAQCHGSEVKVNGDGSLDTATWPNSGIGRINPDGSKGSCSSCHGRHAFSKAQARDPASCMRCHSGPDSPDRAIYEASKHGMAYFAHKEKMNLDADSWVAGKDYVSAPTCTTCHMGPNLGGNLFQKMGLVEAYPMEDLGRGEVTKVPADNYFFKVPALRNIAETTLRNISEFEATGQCANQVIRST